MHRVTGIGGEEPSGPITRSYRTDRTPTPAPESARSATRAEQKAWLGYINRTPLNRTDLSIALQVLSLLVRPICYSRQELRDKRPDHDHHKQAKGLERQDKGNISVASRRNDRHRVEPAWAPST